MIVYGLFFLFSGMFAYYLLCTYSDEGERILPKFFSNLVNLIVYIFNTIISIIKSIGKFIIKDSSDPLQDFSEEDKVVENLSKHLEEDRRKASMSPPIDEEYESKYSKNKD